MKGKVIAKFMSLKICIHIVSSHGSFCLPSTEYCGVPSLPNLVNLGSIACAGPGLQSFLITDNNTVHMDHICSYTVGKLDTSLSQRI